LVKRISSLFQSVPNSGITPAHIPNTIMELGGELNFLVHKKLRVYPSLTDMIVVQKDWQNIKSILVITQILKRIPLVLESFLVLRIFYVI
jgi:hypothetical protein